VGGGREREKESQADNPLSVEPDARPNPITLTPRPELKSRVGGLTD